MMIKGGGGGGVVSSIRERKGRTCSSCWARGLISTPAPAAFYSLVVVLLLICVSGGSEGHVKLNVPRVRLPYFETLSVNFTLKVDTPGCYSWSTSRSNVVTITTVPVEGSDENDGCSDKAIISTIPRITSCCPASAIIFAEDVVTKETVRCDVIVDKISSIQILTTTRELHLEEAPSKFHVLGYGSKENELSTLDGVPFNWVLESPKSKESSTVIDPQSIMRFIPFSESPYEATPGVATLEEKRMQGDTVLLEGIKTGSAVVIARVNDPLYKGLETRVRIIVVASLLLEPGEVWVVPGTIIPLKLWQIRHGKKHEIALPSINYVFSVENEKSASYDRKTSHITALDYGEAKISVKDKNWVDELEEHSEALTAKIHVTEPKYLSLTVSPYKNWALVMGNTYEIQVDVYNSENQKIYVGENMVVDTKFDPQYFRVEFSSKNGTYHIGVPIKLGSSYVTAELTKIVQADGQEIILSPQPRVKSEMEIFQQMSINPKETILPWDPNIMPKYDLRWNPSGGNGNYIWTSSNTSVVTVSPSATGKTEGYGSVNVTVSASVNSFMQTTAKVHVLPPTSMKIVEHIVEAEIGTAIQVPLAFYTVRPNDPNKTEVPYSSCGKLPIRVQVEDPNFVYDAKTHYPHLKPACVVLPIMGNALGSSRVTASYSVLDQYFEDSVIVSTFKPLQTVEPENDMIVLAVGSSKNVVFEGGPRPLLEKQSGFQKFLEIKNETVASYRASKSPSGLKDDIYIYDILCKEIGETDAVFQIGNAKVTEESQPIIRIKVVKVICAEPAQMYFKVETALKSKCPIDGSSAQVVRVAVPNYEPTLVSVVVKDKEGRKFDNITSLKIDWISLPNYVDFASKTYAETESVFVPLGYTDTGKGVQSLIPHKVSGNVEVTARVVGYRDDVLKAYKIPLRKLAADRDELLDLEHSMDLTLVSDVTISPSASISLFNHPSSKVDVKVKDGSGYFEFDTLDSNRINVSYNEVDKVVQIKPLRQGKTTIILKDLCVSSNRETVIDVDVIGIGRIDVTSDDKIPVGGERVLTVYLRDQNGRSLSPDIIKLAPLALRPISSDVLEVTPIQDEPEAPKPVTAAIQYKIVGKKVGKVEVIFTADDGSISSVPKIIDVFPPLTLSPKQLILLPGNLGQLAANGGPSDADIVFVLPKNGKHIASVRSEQGGTVGNVKALETGKIMVTAKSVDPNTKKIYSEDSVNVHVVTLTALKVVSPLLYLYEEEKMPVWFKGMYGRHEISPDLLATAAPSLSSINWQISNDEYGEILQVFDSTTSPISYIGSKLRTQFHALKAGNVTLQVTAYYRSEKIGSQKMEIDIRTYPFGERSTESASVNYWTLLKSTWSTLYYWFILPAGLALGMLLGSLAYNFYIFGDPQTRSAKVDTSLFITQPSFQSPQRFTPSPNASSTSPTSSSSSSPRSNFNFGRASDPNTSHRRLYSRPDSGVYASTPPKSF